MHLISYTTYIIYTYVERERERERDCPAAASRAPPGRAPGNLKKVLLSIIPTTTLSPTIINQS